MPDEMNQQVNAASTQPSPMQQPPTQNVQTKSTSGMGIASLVLGILAILTSFLPFINNGSFVLALLGLIFAVVGIVATKNGKKGGRGIAIAGLVLNILSLVIVLATQSMYGAAIDKATEELKTGEKPVAATTQGQSASAEPAGSGEQAATEQPADGAAEQQPAEDAAAEQPAEADYSNMAIGEAVEFKDGLAISVDGVITGLENYNGEPITGITVTYTNNGEDNVSFNPFDWKAQDVNGIINSMTYVMDAENELSSGQLTPGSTVTGNIYFSGELAKALYYNNIFQSDSEVAWNLQ